MYFENLSELKHDCPFLDMLFVLEIKNLKGFQS